MIAVNNFGGRFLKKKKKKTKKERIFMYRNGKLLSIFEMKNKE